MHYNPSPLTLAPGSYVLFQQVSDVQSTTSGIYPDFDGKFATTKGGAICVRFNLPGTYPYWSYDQYLMTGTIYIE